MKTKKKKEEVEQILEDTNQGQLTLEPPVPEEAEQQLENFSEDE